MTEKKCLNRFKKEWGEIPAPLISKGKDFYPEYQQYLRDLSVKRNVEFVSTVGIFASLSPMKSLELNKRLCENALKGRWWGHFKNQIDKAKAIKNIKDVKEIENVLHGIKTVNFFYNLYTPENQDFVTIDRHMGKFCNNGLEYRITPHRYKNMSNAIKKLAKQLNLLPCQVQACFWYHSKEMWGNNI